MSTLRRRDFLRSGLIAVGAALAGPAVWRGALGAPAQPGPGPYGPLRAPDANGLRLPAGFRSRVIARSGTTVPGTSYRWHDAPDGGATFPTAGGGWIYVSNSELGGSGGGAGAVRFDRTGRIAGAYPILGGTDRNCAGGPTPWGAWLSCEEVDDGRVWECDPTGQRAARVRPAMGVFQHEAAAVDPVGRRVYLTEDKGDGRFYRFRPDAYPDLSSGTLEVALVGNIAAVRNGGRSAVAWAPVPDPSAADRPTRDQVPGSTAFDGGEGCWFDDGVVYFTTKGDGRVWAYDTTRGEIEMLYDDDLASTPILTGLDNIYVSPRSGDVFVAEDGGDLDLVVITPGRQMARMVKVTGSAHGGSEITGPALNPAGDRLYFSSQRGFGDGITYEVSGPFRPVPQPAQPEPPATPTPSPSAHTATPSATPNLSPSATPSPASSARAAPAGEGSGNPTLIGAIIAGGAAAIAGAAAYLRKRTRPRE